MEEKKGATTWGGGGASADGPRWEEVAGVGAPRPLREARQRFVFV